MAPQTARSVDRTLKKMMRRATRPASPVSSAAHGSVNSAAQALANMAELQKRQSRGQTGVDLVPVAKPLISPQFATATTGPATGISNGGAPAPAAAVRRLGVTALVGACVTAAVVAMAAVWMASVGSSHSVAGTVMLDRQPLANVEVSFHPKTNEAPPTRVTASASGGFRVASLPAGEYAIVLSSPDATTKLPRKYRSPESTPFRLKLTKSRSDLRMLASSADRN